MQFKFLKYDIYRYFYPNDKISQISWLEKLKIIVLTPGVWSIFVYRFKRWAEYECQTPLIKSIANPIARIFHFMVEIVVGISIAPEADIGPGLYIGHFGGIFIAGNTKIGKFVNIGHEVTIGYAGRGDKWGQPERIGDFVFIAPGAKIVGKITIGNNVVVGANSVVTKNLPDNAVAFGIPARIINYNTSKDFIYYNYSRNKDIL